MQFSLPYLREILPREDPPLELVPPEVLKFLESEGRKEDDEDGALIRRSALWTYSIFSEFRGGNFSLLDPSSLLIGYVQCEYYGPFRSGFSIGAFDQEYEGSAFGLIFVSAIARRSQIIGEIEFPRLSRSFKVTARALVEDYHSAPSFSNATSTCWASENVSPGRWGFLTCRHAFAGVQAGAVVPLNGGGSATLVCKAPATIDAAFLETTKPTLSTNGLHLLRFPTAGQAVDVRTTGGSQNRSVVSVTDTLGVINDPLHPVKVYIDQPCLPGDSGPLIQDSNGLGVAIYSGELTNATIAGRTGQTVGFAQHLEQAATILNLSPHL